MDAKISILFETTKEKMLNFVFITMFKCVSVHYFSIRQTA